MIPVLGYHKILAWLPYKQGSHVFSNISVLAIKCMSILLTVWVGKTLQLTSEQIQGWWNNQCCCGDLREAQPNGESFTDHHTSHKSSSLRSGSGEPRALGVSGHSELRVSQECIPAQCEDPCFSVEKLIWPCGWMTLQRNTLQKVSKSQRSDTPLQDYKPFFLRQAQESLFFFIYNQRKP